LRKKGGGKREGALKLCNLEEGKSEMRKRGGRQDLFLFTKKEREKEKRKSILNQNQVGEGKGERRRNCGHGEGKRGEHNYVMTWEEREKRGGEGPFDSPSRR